MTENAEDRLVRLGVALPPPPSPAANYLPAVMCGNLLFLSGHGSRGPDGSPLVGQVGGTVTVEQAYGHARAAGLRLLASARHRLGSLGRVRRVVKVTGYVNAAPGFRAHSQVVNGCSDLLVEVFGPVGRHARAAVGVDSLPDEVAVEIEAVLEVQ
ncbi:MAG: RidA family protein [Opitutaceae bacterium]|nr:RidA family protein [Opitutaceae bacterium]